MEKIIAKPIVVKIGGSMMDDEVALQGVCSALARLHNSGLPLVLVHGGGKDINRHLAWLQEEPVFKNGLRVTSLPALKVVEMTLSGFVNKKLVSLLNLNKGNATGLSGVDGTTFLCEQISSELGQVGTIVSVNTGLVETLLAAKFLPVVSPISVDVKQNHFNVNADDAAAALAIALAADKLLFVSDVEGVRGAEGNKISNLDENSIAVLIEDGTASGGMIPKLNSCLAAVKKGIDQVHICGWAGSDQFSEQVLGVKNSGTIIYG